MEETVFDKIDEKKLAKWVNNPVNFATHVLDMKPRDYQKLMLKTNSKKRIVRSGRRIGKCLYKESNVITGEGPKNIEDLYNMDSRPSILTFNLEEQEIDKTNKYTVMDNGQKPVYKITTKMGRTNYATPNHPYLTINKKGNMNWVNLEDLEEKQRIAVPNSYEGLIDGEKLGKDKSRLLGYLVGDGTTSQPKAVKFSNIDKNILDDVKRIVDKFDCHLNRHKKTCDYRITKNNGKYNGVLDFSRKHNLTGKKSIDKEVPDSIKNGTEEDIIEFLSGYWDADGWCSIQNKTYDKSHSTPAFEIGVGTSSEILAKDVYHLLLRIGISPNLSERKVKYNGKYRKAWKVIIRDAKNALKFYNKMNLKAKHKKETLEDIKELISNLNLSNNRYITNIPKNIWGYIKKKQKEKDMSNRDVMGRVSKNERLKPQYSVSREKVSRYADNLEDKYLKRISNNNIIWDEIKSIEYIGEKQTYDLSVAGTHNFISDDIISHNTATMIMHMLWYATTHKGSRQLIVAPRGAQVDAIFEEIRNHINDSDLLQSSIKHSKQYPQTIELQNGAIIKGFSAGTTSGGKGNSIRGQGADWIYIDESDFLGPEDLNAIMGVQIEDIGNIGIWAASTPSGAKKLFHKWCINSSVKYTVDNYEDLNLVKKKRKHGNGWTQFHFPSMVLPSWDEKLEAEMRSLFTEEGYVREVLAEFGEQEGGVYNNDYIDIAKNAGYTYKDMKDRDLPIDNPRIIGVDWDKATNPTNIIIMEFIPELKKFAVVHRSQISPSEFTYDNAVSKVVSLYKRWACNYVYADEGHGEYQVEMLKKKLGRNTVRGHAFNEKVEVMDPVDKKKKKKELKHFMVTETTIMLERKQLAFPSDDEDLIRNFQNYEVVRYTRNGKPIYTDKDEHAHDAVALAVFGFNKEYPDIADLIQRARYAKSVKQVNKKITEVKDISQIFGDSSMDESDDEEREGDNYVRRMKAIERANKGISSRNGFQSWGGRGYSSGPPSRKKL